MSVSYTHLDVYKRQQLARAVRNRTTGVLYVLDEPSIGLHPSNLEGLAGVMQDLVTDGNSVLLVDHDTQVLSRACLLYTSMRCGIFHAMFLNLY